MSNTNTLPVTQEEKDIATAALEILRDAGALGLVGLVPTTLNGTRVLALCVDPEGDKGPAPIALVFTNELFALVDEPEGQVVLEDVEDAEGAA